MDHDCVVAANHSGGAPQSRNKALALFAMLLTPCLASAVFATRDAKAPPLTVIDGRPSLVFSSYMIDEGPVPVRSQPLLTPFFFFTNNGKETVRITELKANCGCLAPVAAPMEIPPGGDGRLTLPIRTGNQPAGPREYMVTVHYEDSRPREVSLTYKVILPEKQIEIEPRVLMVMGRISSIDRDIITISDHRPERLTSPLKITSVLSSSTIFSAQLTGHSTVDGVSRDAIEVTYSESIPMGQHKGVITVTTEDEAYPVLQIPVILGDRKRPADEQVSFRPDAGRIIVDSANPEKSQGGVVTFDIPSKWKVSHLDAFPSQLAVKVIATSQDSPDRTRVTVGLSMSELPFRGIEHGSLILHATDGDEAEMVTAPVTLSWK